MEASLAERKALVVGAYGGMGRAVAVALAREGVVCALVGRNQQKLSETAKTCAVVGTQAIPIVCDIARTATIEGAVRIMGHGGGCCLEWPLTPPSSVGHPTENHGHATVHVQQTHTHVSDSASRVDTSTTPTLWPRYCQRHRAKIGSLAVNDCIVCSA